ncbi:MAG: hypothetical protein GY859_09315, partial [Desulfobacterales bacterium]|nr:hypothetical protein [Desulfobacterales bacterium]
LLHLLLERLEDGPLEQKRCILFNLWRFHTRKEEAAAVYARFLEDEEPDLRMEALAYLDAVMAPGECLSLYRRRLSDAEPRVRKLALEKMGALDGEKTPGRLDEIREMLSDPDMEVKGTAIKILKEAR